MLLKMFELGPMESVTTDCIGLRRDHGAGKPSVVQGSSSDE
jgi:hypothetical protein